MNTALQRILDGLYTMVNALDTLQFQQQFAGAGKNDGTIFVQRIDRYERHNEGFRFSFATAGDCVQYRIHRGRMMGADAKLGGGAFNHTDTGEAANAVERALMLLTELIENLDNNVAL